MHEDDYVETSDPEEREEMQAYSNIHWKQGFYGSTSQKTNLSELNLIQDGPRYSLRRRGANQLKPYTVEKFQYKQALSANPDAIVKFHSPTRGCRRRYSGGDIHQSQEQGAEEGGNWEPLFNGQTEREATPRSHWYTVRMSCLSVHPRLINFNQDGSKDLPSLEDKRSSASPPTSCTWRSITPVSTSSRRTRQQDTLPLPITPDIDGLAVAESPYDMEIDCSASPAHPTVESSDLGGLKTMLDRKSMRALERMMPKFLVAQFMRGDDMVQRPRRQRSLTIDSDELDVTLRPGQTRIRRAERPKQAKEIKGDSENSSDEHSSMEESPLENLSVCSLSDVPSDMHSHEHTIELAYTSDDGESSSSDDGVDDKEIQVFLDSDIRGQSNGRLSVREESLIDWMLAKTRTLGTSRKPSVRKQSSNGQRPINPRSKHSFNITRGSRRSDAKRQTAVNSRDCSDENSIPRKDDGIRPSRTLVSTTSGVHENNSRVMQDYNTSKQRARMIKAKERRSRAKTNGLYTFVPGDTHAVTGRRKTATVSINLEDEDFHRALAPPCQNHEHDARVPRSFTQLHLHERLGHSHASVSSMNHAMIQGFPILKSGVHLDIYGDSILHSGLSFSPDTFTGRGWLNDLIKTLSSPADVTVPVVFTFRGSELGPSTGAEKLCVLLKDLITHFFDFVGDLPQLDREPAEKDLSMATHAFCKFISWFLITCSVNDRTFVLSTVQDLISQSLARLREISSLDAPLDTSTLPICWLMVELSVRIGEFWKESVSWLVHNLLEYGLLQTIVAIRQDNILDGSTTAQYTAELWVRLFHLLDHYHDRNTEKHHIHLFWAVVMESLESTTLSKRSLESSEVIWRTIFSLCALTQFSVHGMTTAASRLPACWKLVVLALKVIRLTADPQADRELSARSIDKRDEYLGLITLRCFRLWNRWHWTLDGASILFNQLVDIFRSRKFANLRHEVADFPAFLLKGDWDLLSSYRYGDTAFELFLKLMFHATKNDTTVPNCTISPTAKKLLSLAIPVSTLPFSRNNVTTVQDLSMLFNRLGAVAIGIYLDPNNHLSRITHARTYVNFSDADDNTRLAVMRGMMNLGILMKTRNVPLDGIAGWVKEMADVLADEFKTIPKTIVPAENHLRVRKDRLVFSVQCLLGCVRRVIEVYKHASEYPEPALLSTLVF
jgi:Mus7/MMS22 family